MLLNNYFHLHDMHHLTFSIFHIKFLNRAITFARKKIVELESYASFQLPMFHTNATS